MRDWFCQDFNWKTLAHEGKMKRNGKILAYICSWPEIFRPQNELEEGKAGVIPASGDEIRSLLSEVMGSYVLSGENNAGVVVVQECKMLLSGNTE